MFHVEHSTYSVHNHKLTNKQTNKQMEEIVRKQLVLQLIASQDVKEILERFSCVGSVSRGMSMRAKRFAGALTEEIQELTAKVGVLNKDEFKEASVKWWNINRYVIDGVIDGENLPSRREFNDELDNNLN